MMRIWIIGVALITGACTQQPNDSVRPALIAPPTGATSAYFTSYPDHLFEAAEIICTGPGQEFVRISENAHSCESLPTPEAAAALILEFNGTVEAIPKFIITFSGQQDSTGYLVTTDSYIRVPQRTGETKELRFPDPEINETFKELLRRAGGRPL